jgi:hypothetical protein
MEGIMNTALLLSAMVLLPGPIHFERHEIDRFPAGYQVAVADLDRDGRPDVIALSTEANRVDWYENPNWRRRPVARTDRNIDLAVYDVDGDGRPEIALASGFHFAESTRGGQISLLTQPVRPDESWVVHPIAIDPVTHRVRWADLDGDGRKELVHAPLFSSGSQGAKAPKPAHLWAFRTPQDPAGGHWQPWKIDETLTVLHGLYAGDLDQDGRDELLTASYEGIHRFDFEGHGASAAWRKVQIAPGAPPASDAPGASRGSSEVAPGNFAVEKPFLAAIEPWHGSQVVVYTPGPANSPWQRRVLDDKLNEGHVLTVADFDADGIDEIVAGWRGAGGGLRLYDPADASGSQFQRLELDEKVPVEGAMVADMNGDGRLDLVVAAGRINVLAWYENQGK